MTFSLILDLVLIGLLGVVAIGGFALHRKLQRLAEAQNDLRSALETFSSAAEQADAALKRIETAGVIKGAELQAAAHRAQKLATDLSVMTAAGERIADRIEMAIRDVKSIGAAQKSRRAA
ncbi:MAG: DUF6468 domain-containing protein [Parvularculaceae bacterium]|nr:DUF6468 domain-containing protein [Parvularculaceae bacterium]